VTLCWEPSQLAIGNRCRRLPDGAPASDETRGL